MKLFSNSFLNKALLVATGVVALAGCDEPDGYPEPKPTTASTVGEARVLLVNAAPGSAISAVTLDNQPFLTTLPYLGSVPYRNVTGGSRLFVVTDPGNIPANPSNFPQVGTPPAPAPPLNTAAMPANVRVGLNGGASSTVFLTDQPTRSFTFPITSTSDVGGIRGIVVSDNLSAPAAGRAKVRFLNLSPSLTTNVGLFNDATTPPTQLFSPRAYRATSTGTGASLVNFGNFTELNATAAGTPYLVSVRTAATASPSIPAQTITLVAGKIYTIYTRGLTGNTTTPLGLSVLEHN